MTGSPTAEKTQKSPLIKQGFLERNKFVLLAFFLPFVLMVYGFYCSDFSPFGDNQILVIDMWHQYFPFFNELQDKITSGGSLLYSWSGALGTNFISLIAYYAASPLNLISIFFPTKYLVECMALIVALKVSFAGAFMCHYLRKIYNRCNLSTVTFSMLYALCAYSLGYYWCLMWLDCLALLPLCMLGLNKLIDEGKFRLYTVTLAMMLVTNYYIGVMMCIFIMIYYPILYFQRTEPKGVKRCAITTGKAVLFSGVAIMIAAIILIPTYLNMQNTYYMDKPMPTDNSFYNSIIDIFGNLFPQVELTVRGGLPNVYCGLFSVIMGIMFLLCKSIPRRKKVLNCIILSFLILSFNWNKLDFIWHGFHFPNELPYRYSFVFSFILVTMAYEAFTHLDEITPAQVGGTVAGAAIYLVLMEKINKLSDQVNSETYDQTGLYIVLLFLALYAIALAIHKSGKFKETAVCVLVFLIAFGEMAIYTEESVAAVGNSNKVTYYSDYDNIQYVLGQVEDNDDGFYRVEMHEPWTCNPGSLYGFRGVSQFSSEINSNVSYMMQYIGLASDPGSNSFLYRTSSPVTNAMLNIKYIFGKSTTISDSSLELRYSQGSTYMYENKYPLSIAYGSNTGIYNWNYSSSNPLDVQENWIASVTGKSYKVYERVADPTISGSNVTVGTMANGRVPVSSQTSVGSSTVNLTYTSQKDQTLYAYIDTNNAQSMSATTSTGRSIGFENNRGAISSLGDFKAGETVTITITYEENRACDFTCDVRSLNTANWNAAYSELSQQLLNVTKYSDTYIKGDVTMQKDGVLMTSIPYTKGWTVKIDGKKVDVNPINNALIAVDITAGAHTVEFSYMPDGFIFGVLLTLLGIALLVLLYFVQKNFDVIKVRVLEAVNIKIEEETETEQVEEDALDAPIEASNIENEPLEEVERFVYDEDEQLTTPKDSGEVIESFDEDTNQNDDETSENVDDVMNEIFPNKEN